jgi:hypothetical protein
MIETREVTDKEYIEKYIRYDSETGYLWLKEKPNNNSRLDQPLGHSSILRKERIQCVINGKKKLAHHVVWFIHYGEWPATSGTKHIDHINRDPSDNRIENLRLVSHTENYRNVGIKKHNTTGAKGVFRNGKKFAARYVRNKQKLWLGTFNTIEEADRAYQIADMFWEKNGFIDEKVLDIINDS